MTFNQINRILIVAGHYGSGKTEFAVSLALRWAAEGVSPLALIDLDIANPYFRSRERRAQLEAEKIGVYGSLYDKEITAELPALGAALRAPLENAATRTIVDAGGNDAGALVLNQFRKYFTPDASSLACVVNFNRFETLTQGDAIEHVLAIERVTKLRASYIINNTHLLRQTTAETVRAGHQKAAALCETLGKTLLCTTFPAGIVDERDIADVSDRLFPIGLHMRESWHDR